MFIDIVALIKSMPDYIGSSGREEDSIKKSEMQLGVRFATDYRAYLKEVGLACFDGRELTGITSTKRLDVVSVTKEKRISVSDIPNELYVVEDTNIDGIVIWQSQTGEIYRSVPNRGVEKIYNSLYEYIDETQ